MHLPRTPHQLPSTDPQGLTGRAGLPAIPALPALRSTWGPQGHLEATSNLTPNPSLTPPFTAKVSEPAVRGRLFSASCDPGPASGPTLSFPTTLAQCSEHTPCLSERRGRKAGLAPGQKATGTVDGSPHPMGSRAGAGLRQEGKVEVPQALLTSPGGMPTTHSCIWPRSTTLGPVPVSVAVPPMLAA